MIIRRLLISVFIIISATSFLNAQDLKELYENHTQKVRINRTYASPTIYATYLHPNLLDKADIRISSPIFTSLAFVRFILYSSDILSLKEIADLHSL